MADLNLLHGTVTNDPDNNFTASNPQNVNDGSSATSSNFGSASHFVHRGWMSDLGSAYEVASMFWHTYYRTHPTYIEHSADGVTWTTAPGTWDGGTNLATFTLTTPTTARYWRGYEEIADAGGYESPWVCYTWKIYGDVPPPPPPVEPEIVFTVNSVALEGLLEKRIRFELNGTGAGHFVIPRGHVQATAANLARGNIVEVSIPEIHSGVLGEFLLEEGDFDLISSDEEGGEELQFGGPGTLGYLGRALIHFEALQSPASVVKLSRGTWEWIDQEAGDIVQRIVTEAQDRGALPGMTITFTETDDSDGNPWTPMGSWKVDIGNDLLTEVLRLVSAGQMHAEMTPGLVFNLYETIGTDRSSSSFAANKVRFVKGVNVVDEIGKSMAGGTYGSHALVRGDDGSWLEVTAPGTPPYRQEIAVEVGSHDADVMESAGLRAMASRDDAQEALIFGVTVPWPGAGSAELDGLYLPGPDWSDNGQYWIGDLVTLHTGTGEFDYDNETMRVYAITLYEDETGYLAPPIVELNAPWVDTDDDTNLSPIPSGGGGSVSGGTGSGSGTSAHSHGQYALTDSGGQDEIMAHGSMGTTETIDPADGNVHTGTLDANVVYTLTAPVGDGACEVEFQRTASGTRTETWPGSVTWLGGVTPDPPADGETGIVILRTLDAGTTWLGIPVGGGGGAALTVENEGTPLATAAETLDFVGPLVTASGTGADKTITVTGAINDLTDATITAPAEDDTLRYRSGAWVNDNRRWEPVTDNPGSGPDLVYEGDDLVMEWGTY